MVRIALSRRSPYFYCIMLIIRAIILLAIVGIPIYIFVIQPRINSNWRSCPKCEGRGFWRATRGERDKCNLCGGSGKVHKNQV